ncbi:helix-turn-helix transcriptional regulator [Aquibium oceanicum]|uniref:LuxR family transcriptional regulator n=1 Tax=Aquibium oceanicum TaxID=1670800 RepID=A0A1L3SVK7_9HYPH|nr:autoinducer binding domain-containing protein [Aquibium oceanicum]APH73449.1 LuxR family transcriptional regulator [Aquibium oceanicum]
MGQFDDTLQFIDDLEHASTPEGVSRLLLRLTGNYGLTALMAGTVPSPGTPKSRQRSHAMLCEWPESWLERYVARNYVDQDPVVTYMKRQPSLVRWSAAADRLQVGRSGKRVMGDAGEFKLNDGLAFPLITLEGTVVMVSLGGEMVDISPEALGVIELAATYAVGRALQLQNAHEIFARRPDLTPRETECLKWAAEGKSEWEISQILGISEHTSEKHLLNAKRKLGAVNRVHAVAEAIRLGYIS